MRYREFLRCKRERTADVEQRLDTLAIGTPSRPDTKHPKLEQISLTFGSSSEDTVAKLVMQEKETSSGSSKVWCDSTSLTFSDVRMCDVDYDFEAIKLCSCIVNKGRLEHETFSRCFRSARTQAT